MNTINFSDIPGNSNLFLDYLYEFDKVDDIYGINFREIEKYPALFSKITSIPRYFRDELTSIIFDQYGDYKPSKLTRMHIEELSEQNTIAIITGQQLGIFGGPLYTFYKTITAIKLAKQLSEIYEDFNFVPLFWMEGDDHDFNEIKSFNILGQDNSLKNISYEDGKREDLNRGSTSRIKFGKGVDEVYKQLEAELRDNDFKEDVLTVLRDSYLEGDTFEESFRQLLFEFFDEEGLIIFNPSDKKVKELLAPVFRKEIIDFRQHVDGVIERSADLEERYHAQVKVRPVNLFINESDGRYALDPDEGIFRVKGKRKTYNQDELLYELEKDPSKFSPNVLLRPICQDFLFPTGAYVAGPAEISYFAQVMPLYNEYEIPAPVIYPRAAATLLERNVIKILDKYELSVHDIMLDEKILNHRIVGSLSKHNINELFSGSREQVEKLFDDMTEKLVGIDPNLKNVVDKNRQKVLQGFEQLHNKALGAEERSHETALRQVDKVRAVLFPDGAPQERKLSFVYFAYKHGLDIMKYIFNELSINKFEHQIIEL